MELPANPGAPSYGQLHPTAMAWHFFGGPSARHQYNGNTISNFFSPSSIQWQYNFHFSARHQYNGNTISIFSARHQYNGNTTICQKTADIDDWRYISINIAHLWYGVSDPTILAHG
jgi:hypothetical protein